MKVMKVMNLILDGTILFRIRTYSTEYLQYTAPSLRHTSFGWVRDVLLRSNFSQSQNCFVVLSPEQSTLKSR